jgi:putative SOS response-associated peptidase YedK
MCGRYFRHSPREEVAAAFRAQDGAGAAGPSYNVAPGQQVLAVRFNSKTGERTLDDLQWGLVPFFAKDPKIAWRTINARAETVDKLGSYRNAFAKRRCLIPADGFFEWRTLSPKKKQPFAIAKEGRELFAIAGLWEAWQDPTTKEWLRSCCVVTTEPNETVAQIHDRMPVILHESEYASWLGEVPASPEELKGFLRPYDGKLFTWPVNPRMNKGDVNEPDGLEPIDLSSNAEAPKGAQERLL